MTITGPDRSAAGTNPVIDLDVAPEQIQALAVQYQAATAAGDLSSQQDAAAALWTHLHPTLQKFADYALGRRGPAQAPSVWLDDLASEMFLEVLDACLSFDPERGQFDAWWHAAVRRRQRLLVRRLQGKYVRQDGDRERGHKADLAVEKMIKDARNALAEELGCLVASLDKDVVRERVEQDVLNSTNLEKLKTNGVLRALADFDRLYFEVVGDRLPKSLDMPGPDGGFLGDSIDAEQSPQELDIISVVRALLTPDELDAVALRLPFLPRDAGSAAKKPVPWKTVGEENPELGDRDVRSEFSHAEAKLGLPHVHWACLSMTADQFDPEEETSPLDRFRQRSSRAAALS